MTTPFVRLYDASRDFEACLNIFYKTIHSDVDFEPARTIGSYIWCRSYLVLEPGNCFVLDDGNNRAVGYIIGTASTDDFAKKWKDVFVATLDGTLISRSNADGRDSNDSPVVQDLQKSLEFAHCSMLQGRKDLLDRYPAHLHIDILPEFQSKGYGPLLIDTFLAKIKNLGASGVHLGMVISNDGAKRFYTRLGFSVCAQVLDGGKSGEVGRDGDGLCLVKQI